MKIKNVVLSISFMLHPLLANAQDIRGSITTNDNRIIVKNIDSDIRVYPYQTTLEPLLGYVDSKMNGRMGLEKYAEDSLSEGKDVKLTLNLALQQKIEAILDGSVALYEADEIMAAVMESSTGKVLAMATSNRYRPSCITQNDIPALNPKFAAYAYEPASVIKPLALAIALEHKRIEPSSIFNTYNGRMELGNDRFIIDDEKFDTLNAADIIVHSSNIGISQIAWRLTGKEFRDGLLKFGLGTYSNIDFSRSAPGTIKREELLNNKIHRANSSYGYGMLVTFTQLLKAYSAFNNDGIAVTPHMIESIQNKDGMVVSSSVKKDLEIVAISKKTANQTHDILLEVVKRGTAVKAKYDGLEIGGKTGTAHIAKNGRYVREYHSSFYGFANDDKGHKYTIGVMVIRAKAKYAYFASQSAVPVAKKIIESLVNSGYLEPTSAQK